MNPPPQWPILISIILTFLCEPVESLCVSALPLLFALLSAHSQSFAASQLSQVCPFLVSSFQPKLPFAMREKKRCNRMYVYSMYSSFTFPMDEELALRLSTSSTSPLATVCKYDRAFFSSETS